MGVTLFVNRVGECAYVIREYSRTHLYGTPLCGTLLYVGLLHVGHSYVGLLHVGHSSIRDSSMWDTSLYGTPLCGTLFYMGLLYVGNSSI